MILQKLTSNTLAILIIISSVFLFTSFSHTANADTTTTPTANSTTPTSGASAKASINNLVKDNLDTTKVSDSGRAGTKTGNNDKLKKLKTHDSQSYKQFLGDVSDGGGEKGIYFFLVKIAKDLKNIFFVIATIYFLIIVLRFLFGAGGDDDVDKFRKGIVRITIGIIVMQLSYSFVILLFDQSSQDGIIDGRLAYETYNVFLSPLLELLKTVAAFFFIAMGVVAFYKLITANGNEEAIKSGKMTVFYAIIGFLFIKLSGMIVSGAYQKTLCTSENKISNQSICNGSGDSISTLPNGILTFINWTNGFVGIIIVLMVVYTGFRLIFSQGEEEEIKKSKSTIIYIIVGVAILLLNYFILTFFIAPATTPIAS